MNTAKGGLFLIIFFQEKQWQIFGPKVQQKVTNELSFKLEIHLKAVCE